MRNIRHWLLMSLVIFSIFAHANESNFQLISFKCETPDAVVDAVPQSPPLDVDDPGTPGCNRWEINVVANGDLSKTQNNWELPLLDVNYGIADNWQLKYEVPYVHQQANGETASSVGESKAGVKFMFFENEQSKLQLAAYPQVSFVDKNSDAVVKGLATSGSTVTLPFLLSKKVGQTSRGDVNLTANLGYTISQKEELNDSVSAAVGLGTPLNDRIAVLGEVSTDQAVKQSTDGVREQLVKTNFGVMGSITKNSLAFASVGHSLYSNDETNHNYVLAGFRIFAGGVK